MDRFFHLINLLPMPLWLAMLLAPHHPATERASRASTLFGLTSLTYLAALGEATRRGRMGNAAAPNLLSLDGVRGFLGTREGALAAWAHMVALDLFAGAWIYRQARRLEAPAWVRVPSILFTLTSGPFGLLLFLLWRALGPKGEALAPIRMEPRSGGSAAGST